MNDRGNFREQGAPPRILSVSDLTFISAYTKQEDLDFLRKHILGIWEESTTKFHVYRCIQEMAFLEPRVDKLPAYQKLIKRADLKTLKFGDVGCAFGQDTRKLILDGVPPENITALDVVDSYWNLSKRLFLDEDLPVRFLLGNFASENDDDAGGINLAKEGLTASFDYVLSAAVLHVLSKVQQFNYVKRAKRSLKPSGMIIGYCVGSAPAKEWVGTPDGSGKRYLNDVDTLNSLFDEIGFADVVVVEVERPPRTSEGPPEYVQSMKDSRILRFEAVNP